MKPHYRVGWVSALLMARVAWGFRTHGADHIPLSGPLIVAGNHISNWDPLLIGLGCPREMHFMAKDELFRKPLMRTIITAYNAVPVRRGVLDRRALQTASEILGRGGALLMFPEGTRDKSGVLRKAKPGVGFIACENRVPVVPAYIRGSNVLRKALLRRPRVEVSFGPPIRPESGSSSEEYRAFARRVMEGIRELSREVEAN